MIFGKNIKTTYLNKELGGVNVVLVILLLLSYVFVFGERLWDLNFMFHNDFDGAKNYYTFYYFLIQDSPSYLWFEGMNYPYGESIIYTDNTPIIAVLTKAILKLTGLTGYGLQIFNLWIIFSLFMGHLVLYKIGKLINLNFLLNIFLSLTVLWLCPSVFRLSGHFNLAPPVYLLLPLYYSLKLLKRDGINYGDLSSLSIFLVISSLIHVYLFAINGVLCGALVGMYLLMSIKRKNNFLKGAKVLISIVATGIFTFLLLQLLDPFSALRPDQVMGYNYAQYIIKAKDLITSNGYFDFYNVFQKLEYPAEDYSFMGSAFLPGMIVITIALFISKCKLGNSRLIIPMIITGATCLFISFGSKIMYNDDVNIVNNFLNPFELILLFTDFPKTLRCINRFMWPFHPIFYLVLFYSLSKCLHINKKVGWICVALVIIPISFDYINIIDIVKSEFRFKNSFSLEQTVKFDIDNQENYEAILPIPYWAVGSESNYQYTIDDNSAWSADCYRISVINKLPLMAGKMSRTPVNFVQNLFTLFDKPSDDLVNRLNHSQKLLIAYDTRNVWPMDENKRQLMDVKKNAINLIDSTNECVQYIKQVDHVKFYSYDYLCMNGR